MGQVLDKLWGPGSHDELTTTVEFEGVYYIIINMFLKTVVEC